MSSLSPSPPITFPKKKMLRGYATMTGDTPHEGHFNFLKIAKNMCEFLIVGITCDDLATQQKRPCIMPFAARRAVLENCKWVSAVVEHRGEPKSVACKRLLIDVCFTNPEYIDSDEFKELRANAPEVKIVCVPRMPDVCSSLFSQTTLFRHLKSLEIFKTGVSGLLLRSHNHIFKPILIATEDQQVEHFGQDGFGFFRFEHLPRNYKHLSSSSHSLSSFPCIAGISPFRELLVNRFFRKKIWCNFVKELSTPISEWKRESPQEVVFPCARDLQDFAQQVEASRRQPAQSLWLVTRFSGITLTEWWKSASDQDKIQMVERVREIVAEIRSYSVLHGDLHPGNVLVDPKSNNVTIIDWGWACAAFLPLRDVERTWLASKLSANWDWVHFVGSLNNEFHTNFI